MPKTPSNAPFHLNTVLVEPSLNRLHRGDQIVHVEPRMMQLLCLLTAQRNVVQERAALLAAVWPDVTVNDESLTKAISDLRKALGDAARQPTFIETIPKVGYRLIASVRPQRSYSAPSPERPTALRQTSPQTRRLWIALAALFLLVCGQWLYLARDTPDATITKQITKSAPIIVTTTVDGEHPDAIEGEVQAVVEAIVEQEIEHVTASSH